MRLKRLLLKHLKVPLTKSHVYLLGAVFTGILLLFVILELRPMPSSSVDVIYEPDLSVSQRQSFIIESGLRNQFSQTFYHFDMLNTQSTPTAQDNIRVGNAYAEMGDLRTAVRYWEQGHVQGMSSDILLLSRMASAYIDLQDWSSARRILPQLIAVDPDNYWASYHLGIIEAVFDVDSAASYLTHATESAIYQDLARAISTELEEINSVSRLISIGAILVEHQVWAYAELAFQHATVMGMDFPEALAYQGWARYQQGKEGHPWINQALIVAPDNPQVIYIQALESRLLGDYEASVTQFRQALIFDPDNPAFSAEIGQTYRLMNDLPSAEEWLARAVFTSDNAPQFQEILASFYVDEGFTPTESIQQLIEDAYSSLPEDADVRASYGWTLYAMGDRGSALAEIEYALTLSVENPRALYYRALIARDDGDTELSTNLLTQVANGSSQFAELARQALSE